MGIRSRGPNGYSYRATDLVTAKDTQFTELSYGMLKSMQAPRNIRRRCIILLCNVLMDAICCLVFATRLGRKIQDAAFVCACRDPARAISPLQISSPRRLTSAYPQNSGNLYNGSSLQNTGTSLSPSNFGMSFLSGTRSATMGQYCFVAHNPLVCTLLKVEVPTCHNEIRGGVETNTEPR